MMNKLSVIDWIALVLVIIGGINWGLIGFFNFDLVATIFGSASVLSRIIFDLVGLSAVYLLFVVPKMGKQ